MNLEQNITDMLIESGADKVGFATLDTMSGGPTGADLTYLLPEAQSAVSFYVAFDKEMILKYLGKENSKIRGIHEEENIKIHRIIWRASQRVKHWLIEQGYNAISVIPNNHYRTDVHGWQVSLPPELSLRYLAVRSGVASFGWSGNVGTKTHGTAIILGGIITDAKLEPTNPIPESESFCDECKICIKVCAYQMFSPTEKTTISLGGDDFSYSKRLNKMRCFLTCGGCNGLHSSGRFSTWSPGRYDCPDNDVEVSRLMSLAMTSQRKRPPIKDSSSGYQPASFGGMGTIQLTCGNCQFVCAGNPKETAQRYKLLVNSGCVIQRDDGTLEVFPTEKAQKEFNKMPLNRQKLYRKDYKKNLRKAPRSTTQIP
ncbi:MAG: epoxyqueuosine reductase [Candidatus Hermodarchaeota archaeon]